MSEKPDTKEIMMTKEAAAYLRCSVPTLRRRIKHQGLPYFKPGRYLYFKKTSLDAWVDKNTVSNEDEGKIEFNLLKMSFTPISEKKIEAWQSKYNRINIQKEIRKSEIWLTNNVSKAKGYINWDKFLTNWFGRQQKKNLAGSVTEPKEYNPFKQ